MGTGLEEAILGTEGVEPVSDVHDLSLFESRFYVWTCPGRLSMPTISMFYGIIVRMYYAPGEHPPPHFHVYYAEYSAKVDIHTCEVIDGRLPRRQTKLVLAWAELHQEDLMADWELVMNGEEPFRIPPLR